MMKHAAAYARLAAACGAAVFLALPAMPAHRAAATSGLRRPAQAATRAPGHEEPTFMEYFRGGRELAQAGEWPAAATLFEAALSLRPGDTETQFLLGTALIQLRRYADALGRLEPLLEKHAHNADLANNVAWIYATATDPAVRNAKKGVTLARRALMDAPDMPAIWNTLAAAHYAAGDYGRALRAARIAVKLAGKHGVGGAPELREMLRRCERAAKASAPGAEPAAVQP